MKNLLLIISFFVISFTTKANDKDSTSISNFKHEVGFHAGSTSGYGPSYRVWYKKFGIQVATLPFFNKNKGISENSNFVYGISLNYKLQQNRFVDLYGVASFTSSISKQTIYTVFPANQTIINKQTNSSIGIGLGLDFKITPELILSTQMGYGIYGIENFYQGNIAGGISLLYKL